MEYYNKLVRDRVPEILLERGKINRTRILEKEEFLTELLRKLLEEAREAYLAAETVKDLERELCDVGQVIDDLILSFSLDITVINASDYICDRNLSRRQILELLVQKATEAQGLRQSSAELQTTIGIIKKILLRTMVLYCLNNSDLDRQKQQMKEDRGGFLQRVYLIDVE